MLSVCCCDLQRVSPLLFALLCPACKSTAVCCTVSCLSDTVDCNLLVLTAGAVLRSTRSSLSCVDVLIVS
jgi:hypothetical protein